MLKLILLPGMDGTGELFSGFLEALPDDFEPVLVRYPGERYLSYPELADLVKAACPVSAPFIIVAESFSTPLAIQYAATNPSNLKGMVLCSGFASSPIKGILRCIAWLFAPVMFRMRLPGFAARFFLAGPDALPSLLSAVNSAITSVQPKVLAARLRAILTCNALEALRRIKAPILYIQAKQDRLVKMSCLEEMLRANQQVNVTALEGPHLILQRSPLKSAEALVQFVRSEIDGDPA